MKKIVIIANKNPFKFSGGVEFVCKMLAEKLEDNFIIYVICSGIDNVTYKVSKINVLEIKNISIPILQDFYYAFKVSLVVNGIKPDLVVDNGCLSFLNNTRKYKTISIAHGTNYGNYLARNPASIKEFISKIYRLFWAYNQKKYIQKVSHIIAVSDKVKEELTGIFYNINKDKIKVIDNGTFIDHFKYKKQNNFFYKAIFVSTDHRWKGVHIIQEIAKIRKDITLLICGKFYHSKLKNIQYKGFLSPVEIQKLQESVDFLIFPSIYEGQSLAVLDSMATGLPIVISKQADPGIIENGKNGYICDNNDINTYLEAIDKLYSDIDKFNEIRESNIKLMQNYTWDIQINIYKDLILKII